jgi:hypothetical protein
MEVLKLVASAETSSDLAHHEFDCHVDVLGAVGMAGRNDMHMAVYRLKYLMDAESAKLALEQFDIWAAQAIRRRRLKQDRANEDIGKDTLMKWLGDVCGSCFGLRFQKSKGAPTLTDRPCHACSGTGLRKIVGDKARVQVMLDIMGKADRAVARLRSGIYRKIG